MKVRARFSRGAVTHAIRPRLHRGARKAQNRTMARMLVPAVSTLITNSALALALVGCTAPSDPPDPMPVPLVVMDGWERVTDASLDVFADQRPPGAVCDDAGWNYDPLYMSLAVGTDLCDYPTFRQPTLEPLEPGDVVDIDAFHGVLTAEGPAEGYMAIAIDGEIVWELSVPIPADAAVIDGQFTVDRSFPLGSEMQFHVHNHGPNGWDLLAVLVTHSP